MDEMKKCEGCNSECEITFEDVMGNPRCNICLPGLDDDEFDGYDDTAWKY